MLPLFSKAFVCFPCHSFFSLGFSLCQLIILFRTLGIANADLNPRTIDLQFCDRDLDIEYTRHLDPTNRRFSLFSQILHLSSSTEVLPRHDPVDVEGDIILERDIEEVIQHPSILERSSQFVPHWEESFYSHLFDILEHHDSDSEEMLVPPPVVSWACVFSSSLVALNLPIFSSSALVYPSSLFDY